MKVVFSARAEADLREIALYIGRDNITRARSFIGELRRKAKELALDPLIFPLVPQLAHLGIRRRVYRDFLIFYRADADAVRIAHVLHGARDYEAVFGSDRDTQR